MQEFLKRSYLKMHIFSKTTNDVGVLKQRLVSTSNTSVTALHSLSHSISHGFGLCLILVSSGLHLEKL